jgi:hypothetical protein
MSIFSDIGTSLVTQITGVDPASLQAQITAGEQQLSLAIETMIGLTAVNTALLFLVVVLLWKEARR